MKDTINAAIKSPKTTALGVLAFLAALFGSLEAQFDASPETVPQWATVVSALMVAIALFSARDHGVTSEEAGAKEE